VVALGPEHAVEPVAAGGPGAQAIPVAGVQPQATEESGGADAVTITEEMMVVGIANRTPNAPHHGERDRRDRDDGGLGSRRRRGWSCVDVDDDRRPVAVPFIDRHLARNLRLG
jgi:hypothetical protein